MRVVGKAPVDVAREAGGDAFGRGPVTVSDHWAVFGEFGTHGETARE